MGYHYNLAQLISLQVVDGDSVLFQNWMAIRKQDEKFLPDLQEFKDHKKWLLGSVSY